MQIALPNNFRTHLVWVKIMGVAALIMVATRAKIDFYPVAITLQSMVVLGAAYLLRPGQAMASPILAFSLNILLGVTASPPVASFGFMVGMVLGAGLTAVLSSSARDLPERGSAYRFIGAGMAGNLVIWVCGATWPVLLGLYNSEAWSWSLLWVLLAGEFSKVLIYIPGDTIKVALAAYFVEGLRSTHYRGGL
jgi:biotin transporter BioY